MTLPATWAFAILWGVLTAAFGFKALNSFSDAAVVVLPVLIVGSVFAYLGAR